MQSSKHRTAFSFVFFFLRLICVSVLQCALAQSMPFLFLSFSASSLPLYAFFFVVAAFFVALLHDKKNQNRRTLITRHTDDAPQLDPFSPASVWRRGVRDVIRLSMRPLAALVNASCSVALSLVFITDKQHTQAEVRRYIRFCERAEYPIAASRWASKYSE